MSHLHVSVFLLIRQPAASNTTTNHHHQRTKLSIPIRIGCKPYRFLGHVCWRRLRSSGIVPGTPTPPRRTRRRPMMTVVAAVIWSCYTRYCSVLLFVANKNGGCYCCLTIVWTWNLRYVCLIVLIQNFCDVFVCVYV